MRDFQKIDWKTYNKPPFYQQWMCKDETLKLAAFGDNGLRELDECICSLKDQWYLDNAQSGMNDAQSDPDDDQSDIDDDQSDPDDDQSDIDDDRSNQDNDQSDIDDDQSNPDDDQSDIDDNQSNTDNDQSNPDDDQSNIDDDRSNQDDTKDYFLDRIGKLLSEPRNGNDDNNNYRIFLNLRKLLNTNDGSIPDIIKVIKYLYSSEDFRIVPNYPAGLIVEHDGEGTPGLNFNRLLTDVIPAGVSFSTKELFKFGNEDDKFTVNDTLEITAWRIMEDRFQNGLKYNGRGKYDGKTLKNTDIINFKHNRKYKYNAVIQYGTRETNTDSYVIIPFKYSNGIKDIIAANISQAYTEYVRLITKYNGIEEYNGEKNYSGYGENSLYDVSEKRINTNISDSEATVENLFVQMNTPIIDEHFTAAAEIFTVDSKESAAVDEVSMADNFLVNKRLIRMFDGAYKYNGVILYNGNALIPM